LNPRLRPWQGRTLPLSYSRPKHRIVTIRLGGVNVIGVAGAVAECLDWLKGGSHQLQTVKPAFREASLNGSNGF